MYNKPMIKISGASKTILISFAIFSKYLWFQTKQFTKPLEFITLVTSYTIYTLILWLEAHNLKNGTCRPQPVFV